MTFMSIADTKEYAEIAAFAEMAEGAATASLYLLRAVDGTVDALDGLCKQFSGLAKTCRLLEEAVSKRARVLNRYIDEDDQVINSLKNSSQSLEGHLSRMLVRKAAIDKDHELKPYQRDLLHDSYERCANEMAELTEAIKDMRAAIIAHDLAVEPRDVQDMDVHELIESLRC